MKGDHVLNEKDELGDELLDHDLQGEVEDSMFCVHGSKPKNGMNLNNNGAGHLNSSGVKVFVKWPSVKILAASMAAGFMKLNYF